jgi:hypothetical protein
LACAANAARPMVRQARAPMRSATSAKSALACGWKPPCALRSTSASRDGREQGVQRACGVAVLGDSYSRSPCVCSAARRATVSCVEALSRGPIGAARAGFHLVDSRVLINSAGQFSFGKVCGRP